MGHDQLASQRNSVGHDQLASQWNSVGHDQLASQWNSVGHKSAGFSRSQLIMTHTVIKI